MRERATPRTRRRRPALLVLLAALPALCMVMFTGGSAAAHGAPMDPGSRTYLCWKYSVTESGAMDPANPACRAALQEGGANAFYNWFAVLQSNGGGRTEGYIPDGQLCSGAATVYDFSGFDLPRTDWPYTHVTAGDTYEFTYNPWAHHPGTFHTYVTEDGWDPTQPLTWDDIEDEPFHSETDPPYRGSVGNAESEYYWDVELPSDKTGRHIIYTVWERSDSQETFYGCSDVVFDGGNGEVTVPGDDGGEPGPGPGPDPGPDPEDGFCAASLGTVSSWNGGFQAEVRVTNNSDAPITNWTASWSQPAGNAIQSVWNGAWEAHGNHIMVRNAAWNGSLAPGASTTFGYTSNGAPPPASTAISCGVS
ncbi:lytic polysaccharide monooxygenase [Streptomyces marincola]|uniref:lytic polysaccharide monooxygenase n=1 Tax=Streptomyces marincola TaxID=2878388 RepID=UPI001CF57817|nr:lytic polysaccharide monooxygenase [Streptomyces marincola]UCM90968.1 lytic polysaccharide monooxygenase [Streptomyces marincola]